VITAPIAPRRLRKWVPARRRLAVSAAVGLIVGGALTRFVAWEVSTLVAWCGLAGTFVGVTLALMVSADSAQTRATALREDESRFVLDLILLAASIVSLVGVGFILLKASSAHGLAVAGMTALGVVSVILSWALVHTVYALRYADLYYSRQGGIEFNQPEDPDYRDFAYLAFTIGMTYQVSDTNLKIKAIRHTALRHALLSYLFGTVIIAVTINIVAGLAHG
jgi:uncharacterized membrane protein